MTSNEIISFIIIIDLIFNLELSFSFKWSNHLKLTSNKKQMGLKFRGSLSCTRMSTGFGFHVYVQCAQFGGIVFLTFSFTLPITQLFQKK